MDSRSERGTDLIDSSSVGQRRTGISATGAVAVKKLVVRHVAIPLLKKVQHASAQYETSENLIVEVHLNDGTCGFGEGVPRPYVTGETLESATQEILNVTLDAFDPPPTSFRSVVLACRNLEMPGSRTDQRKAFGNAARCALETALLDAYGRVFDVSLSEVFHHLEEARPILQRRSRVRYGHVITAGTKKKEFLRALRTRLYGFRDCKVKVGVEAGADVARLRRIRRVLGWRIDLRLDANEAWPPEEVLDRIRELLPFGITAVEQPVRHEDVACLASVRGRLPVALMLDESLCSMEDARKSVEEGTADMFNIRLSKCGGLIASVAIAAFAHRHGIGYQLGCQVGETGILSALGRHFATNIAGIRYLEGSYDRHLLAEPLTVQDITFGYGGWAPALSGPGLGIDVDRSALERVTVHRVERDLE